MRIAAHLGVKDEIEILEDAIAHLRSIGVDHIVAVDGYSTDGTADILAQHQNKDDFWFVQLDDLVPDETGEEWLRQNLQAIATIGKALGLPVGLSDHGTDPNDIVIAVALGAVLYERHIVLEEDSGAIDAAVSSTPHDLAVRLQSADRAKGALGDGRKVCLPTEAVNVQASRRALYATRDLEPGETVRPEDVVALRPAAGLPANRWHELVGCRLQRPVSAGAPFEAHDLDLWAAIGRAVRNAA